MIDRLALGRFLSGRLLGLIGSLGVQIAVVRILPTVDYARYALAIALAALLQTLTSVGLPRVTALFLSRVGEGVSRRAARRLIVAMLGVRIIGCASALALTGLAFRVFSPASLSAHMIYAGAAYAVFSALQVDADGIAQSFGLQIASRRAAVSEPLIRVAATVGLAMAGAATAAAVLWISAASAGLATAMLLTTAFKALAGRDAAGPADRLDWGRVRSVALGGYGGTLSWLAFSPAVVRLIASRVLPVTVFAGFSFVQTLAISLQRYAPGFTLFPLIEPAAMADAARRGRPDRLRAALSLLVKADAIAVGAVIVGVSAAGAPLVGLLAHGRYGDAAIFLPWLLMGIVANASHRSYEIAAVALGEAWALSGALGFTLGWLTLALIAGPRFGVWPLLLVPLADALTRFWFVQRALGRRGAPGLLDPGALVRLGAAVAVMSLAGAVLARATRAGLIGSLCIGTAGAVGFLVTLVLLRPIRPLEEEMLTVAAPLLRRIFPWRKRHPSSPFRVIVLTPRGFGGTGGVDRLMDSLRPALGSRRDIRVAFVTTRGRRRWASPVVSAWAAIRVATAATLGLVDMIHVNLGAHASCYRKMALIAIPRRLGIPFAVHLHGSAFDTFWAAAPPVAQRQIDALFRDASQVIVLGAAWRRLVADRLPDVTPRLTVLPNATPPFEGRRSLSVDTIQIVFLGDLSPRKGSSILLEALSRLETRTLWRAIIAGNGDVVGTRRQADRLGLGDRVTASGWVDPAGVEALLASSHILVLPSFEENLPMAVIEAFAAGLAVIATPVGALPDILKHGETGLFVTPGDVDGLARALSALIDDRPLRETLGRNGQAYHAAHLALEPYIDRLIGIWSSANTP